MKNNYTIHEQLKNYNSSLYKRDWVSDMKKLNYPKEYIDRCKKIASEVLNDSRSW